MPGVLRTRVGYSGGTQKNPDYHDLKDHSETVHIQFDPSVISYPQLLRAFWANHEYATPIDKQYKSAVFYNNETQKAEAEASVKEVAAKKLGNPAYHGKKILTVIEPATLFYVAELFHQKYFLQCNGKLFKELQKQGVYIRVEDVTSDRMSASLNGFLAGHGTMGALMAEVDSWPVSFLTKYAVFAIVGGQGTQKFKPFDDTAVENPLPVAWVGSGAASQPNGKKRKFEDINKDFEMFHAPAPEC